MPNAVVMLREAPHYRRDAFREGLANAGYSLVAHLPQPTPDDVLVIWNRYAHWHDEAKRWEAAGARVIVAENGYLGREWRDDIWYSMALGHHNGHGSWPIGEPARARRLFNGYLHHWRLNNGPVVLLGQRGIGVSPVIAPPRFWSNTLHDLQRQRIPVVFRQHPGNDPDQLGLEAVLRDARAAVTWSSGAAIKALLFGVPVYHGLPTWIGALAAKRYTAPLTEPFIGDRWPMLERLAWAMWNLQEIQSGAAFDHLLRRPS